MYLLSAYFDAHTNKTMNRYIGKIAEKTGNTFMIENQVRIKFDSVGMFFPYVMYLTPVLNAYLQEMAEKVYHSVCDVPEVSVSKCYQPMQWFPHITMGKKLTKEQMRIAFAVMQEDFAPFEGQVTSIGLAKTNPHEDIWTMALKPPTD